MEIRFSPASLRRCEPVNTVLTAVEDCRLNCHISSHRGDIVRFNLIGADVDDHDRLFTELFEHDPEARIRTARAVYENREDFEAQRKARVA